MEWIVKNGTMVSFGIVLETISQLFSISQEISPYINCLSLNLGWAKGYRNGLVHVHAAVVHITRCHGVQACSVVVAVSCVRQR